MALNFNGKTFRRLLGLSILVAIIFVVGPALLNLQSGNAIINARTIAVNAPIEGIIAEVYQPVGSAVALGKPLFTLRNPRVNDGLLNEVLVESQTLAQRLDGLQGQIEELESIQKALTERRDIHAKHETTRIEHQIAEASAQALAQRGQLEELGLVLDKNRKLLQEKFISVVEFDRSRYAHQVAQQQLEALEAKIRSLQTEHAALQQGVYLGEGRNDVPYTQQKIEDIKIQVIDLLTRRNEIRSRLTSVEKQIEAERVRLAQFQAAVLNSPVSGLVWRQYVSVGSDVSAGAKLAELINCDLLFVEAVVPDTALATLTVGSKVRYRLLGTDEWHEGEVSQVMGSGSKAADMTLAASLDNAKAEGRIFVRLGQQQLSHLVENQCYVGRRVDVTLKRQWNPRVALSRFTNLFR